MKHSLKRQEMVNMVRKLSHASGAVKFKVSQNDNKIVELKAARHIFGKLVYLASELDEFRVAEYLRLPS
jgi:hypothetical protein